MIFDRISPCDGSNLTKFMVESRRPHSFRRSKRHRVIMYLLQRYLVSFDRVWYTGGAGLHLPSGCASMVFLRRRYLSLSLDHIARENVPTAA